MAGELTLGDKDAMGEMTTDEAVHLEMRFGPRWKELTIKEAIELLAAYIAEADQIRAAGKEAEAGLIAIDAEIAALNAEQRRFPTNGRSGD